MSGDVQPRKRKDKKRKKDELGIEEPRGTAAALGEGDVFMHTGHDHGTGGHWCAKVIFFSLLAILVTLIGLIILENRGLSELEANSVESRYSGVLEGWLEDAPDDDHHDEHTLELNHHDDDDEGHDEHAVDDEHNEEDEVTDDDEHGDDDHDDNEDDEHLEQEDEEEGDDYEGDDDEGSPSSIEDDEDQDEDADNDENDNDDQLENDDSQEQDLENDEDDDDEPNRETYQEDEEDDADENADLQEADENDEEDDSLGNDEHEDDDENNSNEIYKNEFDEESEENERQDEDDDEHEEEEEDDHDEEVEVEKLEKEIEGLEPVSTELPALPEEDDDDDDKDEDQSDEKEREEQEDSGIEDEDEAEEFLEMDDADEPPVEKITVPAGKPFDEVEEEVSSEQPPDTLEEEEEYEKRQEELRREEAQASHMWLKLGVGGALLVATHAVMRRATHRDTSEREERTNREETPVDRRLTLIPEEPPAPVRKFEPISRPVIEKPVLETVAPVFKSVPIRKQESEEEEEERQPSEDEEEEIVVAKSADDKELYSDEEPEEDIEEEEEDEEIVPVKKEISKPTVAFKKPEPEPEPEEDPGDDEDPEDVEIIGDEQLEEELEEEGDEEEISDVDDAELLTRLEAKYGRLPEPERPGQKKDGGNSIDDLWPGEPSDAYWRQQLDSAEEELRQGSWSTAATRAGAADLRGSGRARFVLAKALDLAAEAQRDNRLLTRAIAAYLDLLKMNDQLSDKKLLQVSARALDRIQFRGTYLSAEPVYRLLIRRFPNEPAYRNNLTISFLMANRVDLAEETLKETLQRWPKDRVALAHYAFVLKTKHNKYKEAAELFKQALEGDTGPANEPRFYYHYGDSLLLLGRPEEAHEVHKRGAKLGHFLSPSQRSLYNVDRLKSTPWWDVEKTPYLRLAKALEKSWKEILKEGEAARALYEKEKEGLKERGDWSQLDLFVRGQELPDRCTRAPVTCSVVKSEPAAAGCRRGQVKFSLMAPGTHVRAHVGPTNCRLRMHLGLSNTKDTYIRVDKEIRQWQVGKVLMFDDSFEHEVWHNGTGARLVLIVDVWHPHLTAHERRQLPAI